MNMYSMPGYFQNMPTVGKALVNPNPENEQELKAVENDIQPLQSGRQPFPDN